MSTIIDYEWLIIIGFDKLNHTSFNDGLRVDIIEVLVRKPARSHLSAQLLQFLKLHVFQVRALLLPQGDAGIQLRLHPQLM